MGARVFLDANILFSAAYREGAGLLRLWQVPGAALLTSSYAAQEAKRNLMSEDARERLERLLDEVEVVAEPIDGGLPRGVSLPEKDRPILLAAILGRATHLLTGDVSDFGRYFGKRVGGVMIQTPGEFLARARKRQRPT